MRVLLIVLGVLYTWLGYAQPANTNSPYRVTVRHIGVDQGLPNRTVLHIGQDGDGFIWIGTIEDVYRFDGRRLIPLPALDSSARNVKTINLVMTDDFGNLWLNGGGTEDGRNQYVMLKGHKKPEVIQEAFKGTPFTKSRVNIFAASPHNRIRFFRTKDGTIWYQKKPGTFKAVFSHPYLRNNFKNGLCETTRKTLLIALPSAPGQPSGTITEVDTNGRILHQQFMPQLLNPIYQEPDGTIYCNKFIDYAQAALMPEGAADVVLYRLRPSGALENVFIPFIRDHKDPVFNTLANVNSSYDAFHGLFWLCGPNKLIAWHPQHGVVFDIRQTNFPSANIGEYRNVFVDRTGAVWVSTLNGVVVLTLEENHFRRFLYLDEPNKTGEKLAIRGMVQNGRDLWVNASKPYIVDLKTGTGRLALKLTDPKLMYTLNLYPAIRDPKGNIWASAGDIIKVNPATYAFETGTLQIDNSTVSLWHDGKKRIWVGHIHGISVFDTDTRQDRLFTGCNQFKNLAESQINGFFPDKRSGKLWLATTSGLYLLDTLKGVEARYSVAGTGNRHLPFDNITFLYPDPDQPDTYWLATRGGGLLRWHKRTGQYRQFTDKQGLSDNTLYAIYEDRFQRLWLPSNRGLMSFHRKTHQVQIYHKADGITDEEFNLLAHLRGDDGQLFFGGLNGVTAFYPDRIRPQKPQLVPLLVTQYQKLDTETGAMADRFADYEADKAIHLSASDRLFTLSFSLLDFREQGTNRLWYRIDGWQDNWVMQEQLDLRINGLPAGDYTLQVRAQAGNGMWASGIVSIPVSVDKPVYLRTWFLLLSLLLLMGAGQALFRWRNRQLVTEKIRLEQEVARRTARIERDKAIIEHDKTIIEKQAADLRANDTLKSRFFANVSHEFRTPLTLLLGPIQFLSRQVSEANARQLLQTMERNTRQLLTLVNDLLDLSRLDAGELVLNEKPGDLSLGITQVAADFRPAASYAGIDLQIAGTDAPVWMLVDLPRFETVLRNLLSNAVRYTQAGGSVCVRLLCREGVATVAVADTGPGIHPDDLPYIFDRYFQTRQVDKPLQGGTGIGLALCREYCTLWGGTLTVSSEPGQGSTFTITYPIRQVSPPVLPPRSTPAVIEAFSLPESAGPEQEPTAGQVTVLVVEDHADLRFYIQTVLAPYYDIQTARNGKEALDWLKAQPDNQLPKLIVSDIMMPEIDGLTMSRLLREQAVWRHIPIVLLTARADLDSRLQALQLGVADYLTKPFQEAELIARVRNLLVRSEELINWRTYAAEPEPAFAAEAPGDDRSQDTGWISTVQDIIRQHLSSSMLNVRYLAEAVGMSERQFYRQCKALTGMSPNQLIHEVRLQVAHELLRKNPEALVKTIALEVGYSKSSYFIQLYRERFGVPPGQYLTLL
ncbi:hybrid sensor histidine kinase/response regulator transcription factor [Arsenicibacter rosenii]|uniref:histidine kinase n=1 Tax=Arsenicibacter rosenii TaxID=1750698 RepID=A0A1S2VCE9_9BACT|nr:ATP-binding protein [Arsenicibacter rosenii]OIN55985.1 hypothetical protein BLX24_26920 [Arsenicibacter rosenii]